jgi:Ni,Fe-hydrogenase III large subunit
MYREFLHEPIIKHHGDVYARASLRKWEIKQSITSIKTLLQNLTGHRDKQDALSAPAPDAFTVSLVEGWRGEVCHCALTDDMGQLMHYKIKDASFHNWLALSLAVRNNEISDFPVCNKSFDLSYCGHDL